MVGKVDLKMTGGPALEAALRDLGGQVAGRLGENAVRAGARVIATRARQKAPKGETGELKRSIRAFQDTERRAGERTAYAGSRLFYARFIEFGTRFIPARSFLRNALDESGQEAVNNDPALLRQVARDALALSTQSLNASLRIAANAIELAETSRATSRMVDDLYARLAEQQAADQGTRWN